MGRPTVILLVLMAAIGAWFFFTEMSRRDPAASAGPGSIVREVSRVAVGGSDSTATDESRGVIRVATMNLDSFDSDKAARLDVVRILAQMVSHFDVVALQEITSGEQHVLPTLVDAANQLGGNYDFVIGPRTGRGNERQQFAFVYDKQRVDVDRYELYSVQDPDDLLQHEPLVGWFRARGVEPSDAFTFTLVNMLVNAEETVRENRVTRSVFEQVRNDRRGEDDVILLGDFGVNADQLRQLVDMPNAVFTISDMPTNPQHNRTHINVVVDRHATVELTGRSGVFDFLRELNLTMEQALSISEHLPVWAEFSVYEGGQPGRVAASSSSPSNR